MSRDRQSPASPPTHDSTLAEAVDARGRAGHDRRCATPGPPAPEAWPWPPPWPSRRRGAAADWGAAVGGATTQDFFDAASRGRRWREAPTATLSALAAQRSPHSAAYAEALAEVASAACELGEPTMRVIGNASVAAAAQLTAAGAAADCRWSRARRRDRWPAAARRPAGRAGRGDGRRAGAGRAEPSRSEEPRGAARGARRPDRPGAGQARDPPAGRPAAGGEAARARPA